MSWEAFADKFVPFCIVWFLSFICFVLACLLYLLCEKILSEGPLFLDILADFLMYIVCILLLFGLPYLGMYEFIIWSRKSITNEIVKEKVEKAVDLEKRLLQSEHDKEKHALSLENSKEILDIYYWFDIAYVLDRSLNQKEKRIRDNVFEIARNRVLRGESCDITNEVDSKAFLKIEHSLSKLYTEISEQYSFEMCQGKDTELLGYPIRNLIDYQRYIKLLTIQKFLDTEVEI